MLQELGTYEYHPRQRERFRTGILLEEWYKAYPFIFDEQDAKIARNQTGATMNYHFFEWLAAVLLYQSFGFYSLVEQYEFKSHKRKQDILRGVLSDELFHLITDHEAIFGGVQAPDLFVYSPDYSEWFFCEVKGPKDRLGDDQVRYFKRLSEASQKPIRLIRFKPAII